MVATEFLGYINSFSATNYVGVEDLADRANFQWSVIVLLLCMALVTVRQYFMAPLVCYLPTTVSGGNAESYVTNLCWVEGTFPINLTSGAVPHELKAWEERSTDIMNDIHQHDWDALKPTKLDYYQWVPLVLGLQAILYYIPRIVWSIFTYNRTGTDLQNLVRTASNAAKEDGEKREKTIRHLAKSLELMLFSRRQYHSRRDGRVNRAVVHLPGKRHGNNLIYYYIFIKLLYVIVGILQLYLMYAFLRFDQKEGYFFFGVRILDDIRKGKPWTETQVFPRVGVCRQALQHVAATNNLFAQCVLPINMLNEKIYVFLYFFLAGVMFFTILSIPLWIFRIAPKRQGHFVKRFLKMADAYNRDDPHQRDLIDRFVTEFLRQDGHFLLRMLSMNAGDLITVEIVCCLFGDYRKQYYGKDFRGLKSAKSDVNEYGDPLKMKLAAAEKPPYPAGPSVPNGDFMSAKLQPGGYATTKQRPLPTAPPGGSPPYPQVIDGEDFKQVVAPPVYPTLPEYPGPEQDVAIIHRPPPPPHLRTPSGHLLQAPATPQPKEEGSSSPKEVKTSNV